MYFDISYEIGLSLKLEEKQGCVFERVWRDEAEKHSPFMPTVWSNSLGNKKVFAAGYWEDGMRFIFARFVFDSIVPAQKFALQLSHDAKLKRELLKDA